MSKLYTVELDVSASMDADKLLEMAGAYNIDVSLVNECGPGGGNPVYEFVADDLDNLVMFLKEEYGDDDGYFANFINPVVESHEVQEEIMAISQEECAEVIQALSKIMRFGLNTSHNGITNKEHLEEEIGDLLCMFQLMEEYEMVDWSRVSIAASNKRKKLKQWSNIFKDQQSDGVDHSAYYFDTERNR